MRTPDVAYLGGRNTSDSVATTIRVRMPCRIISQFGQQSIQRVAVTVTVVLVCVNLIIKDMSPSSEINRDD